MIIATDTTSYPNLILTTIGKADGTLSGYELTPAEGYVIHFHETCLPADDESGIPAECYYRRFIGFAPSLDLSTINSRCQAVLESSVPADSIFGGGDGNHEIM